MELTELNKVNFKNNITTNFACEASGDGRISIVTDLNILVIKYKPVMHNETNSFLFTEAYVNCSNYHVANETGKSL